MRILSLTMTATDHDQSVQRPLALAVQFSDDAEIPTRAELRRKVTCAHCLASLPMHKTYRCTWCQEFGCLQKCEWLPYGAEWSYIHPGCKTQQQAEEDNNDLIHCEECFDEFQAKELAKCINCQGRVCGRCSEPGYNRPLHRSCPRPC